MPCCPFYGRYLFLIFSCHADGQMILGEPLLSAQSVSPGQHHLDTHPSLRTVYPTREPRRTSELSSKGKHLLAVHFLLRTVTHTHTHSRASRQASAMASFSGFSICAP